MGRDDHQRATPTGRIALYALILAVLLTAAMLLLPPGLVRLAGAALLFIPLLLVVFDRPEWVFYLLIFLSFSNIYIFFPLPVVKLTVLALIALFAVAVAKGRIVVIHDLRFAMMMAAFFLLAFQSIAFARDAGSSLMRLGYLTRYIIFLFFLVQFSRTRRELILALAVMVCGGVVDCFMPFIVPPPDTMASLSLIWNQAVLRFEGYNGEANMFAFSLNFLIPLQLFLFARLRRPWFMRPLLLAVTGGTVFVLFLSFSRGAFVGLVVLFISLLFIERRNKAILATGLALLAAGAILAPAMYWDRIGSMVDVGNSMTEDTSILSRLYTMKVAFILGLKNPVFGIGMENFLFYVNRFIPFGNVVHNSLLQVFAEIGVIALGVVVAMIVHNYRMIMSLARRSNDGEAAQMGRILFIQHTAVIANSMFLPVAFDMVFLFTLILPSIAWKVYAEPDRALPDGSGWGK